MFLLNKGAFFLSLFLGLLLLLKSPNHLAYMFVFLVLAVWATRYQYWFKKEKGIYEHERGVSNVVSNGLAPLLFAYAFSNPLPYIASVSAALADKFASELGVLGGENPRFLLGWKEVPIGTSGSVTLFGTVMSLGGSTIMAVCAIVLFGISITQAFYVSIFGFVGSVFDSLAGILEEKGIGTKETSNIICTVSAGLLSLLLIQ